MMFQHKTTIILLMLYAATSCSAQVSKCCVLKQGWQFGSHGLYVQVSSPAFRRYQQDSLDFNLPWSWGFALDASYQDAAADGLSLNWYHFRHQFDASVANLDGIDTSVSKRIGWDQVNADISNSLQLGVTTALQLHGGANYSRLAFQQQLPIDANYQGLGMRTGLMLVHDFQNHFTVYVDGAMSLLAGSSRTSHSTDGSTIRTSQMRIVPELDGHVGTTYDFYLSQSVLSADISWLWINYMNAFAHESYNLGLQGLYFGLKWTGDME